MSRWVIPDSPSLKAGVGDQPDGALGRIVKYVPAEIVGAYTLVVSGLATVTAPKEFTPYVAMGILLLFLVVTIVYVLRNTSGKVRQAHLIVSPVSFLAWGYPISSAVLGEWFVPLAAFLVQTIAIALAIMVAPKTTVTTGTG
jgi:hypothetical protein